MNWDCQGNYIDPHPKTFLVPILPEAIDLPDYLPVNYSNFMNWSSPNKVIIQGITESEAAFYAMQMKAYGTDIVAGVSPGRGGTTIGDIPVYDLVEQVLTLTERIDTSLIFVPPYQVLDAAREAISAGIKRIIIITSNVPPLDTIQLIRDTQAHNILLLGPGSDGITQPGEIWLGKLQPQFYPKGKVGIITTSKDLSYEVAAELKLADMGLSTVVSLGNDSITGANLSQWLSIFDEDPQTEAIVSVGQKIKDTEDIVCHCREWDCNKPIIAYTAGLKTPQERVFRDAITIISNHLSASIPSIDRGRRTSEKLKKAGISVAKRPSEIPSLLTKIFQKTINIKQ